MTLLKSSISLLLIFLICQQTLGQVKKSEKEYKIYFKSLQIGKIDTILILKSGCTGCEVKYSDTLESIIDGQTIYILTQKNELFKLAIFDDIHAPKYVTFDTCTLFKIVAQNKTVLKSKESFYKKELAELQKSKFIPPRPTHYSFEDLTIKLPGFKYNFTLVEKNADYLGFIRENEKWFQVTKTIIEKFLIMYAD